MPRRKTLERKLLALLRHADRIEEWPSLRTKRKIYARTEFFSVCPKAIPPALSFMSANALPTPVRFRPLGPPMFDSLTIAF
jgi:hypothetical protein